jgi:hypothetical protein
MTELRKAAEMALKRLDMYFVEHGNDDDFEATQALRQALEKDADEWYEKALWGAQPEQEPVAWLDEERKVFYWHNTDEVSDYHGFKRNTPLYTAPPISDYHEGWEEGFKAATREHEPVAWMKPSGLVSPYKHGSYQIPLYTAPPKKEWVGLTDQEKYDVLEGATGDGGRVYYDTLFRSYEVKLKEKNHG